MTLSVLITIDTESYAQGHPDEHIWGRTAGGEETGIRRIMGLLEKYGARGTFYVNVYEAGRHGDEAMREVIRAIHGRGHEVALHSHPRDRYGVHKLTRADEPRQREILAWGKSFIEQATGQPVLAHRAGAFAANLNTLQALGALGIAVDSSLSPAWFESHLAHEVESNNQPLMLSGVLELPITYYVQARIGRRRFLRMVDIEACSLRELRRIVTQAVSQQVTAINLLMHSHSFALSGPGDSALVRRLEGFLQFLAETPQARASTTREFYDRWQAEGLAARPTPPFLPATGWWLAYLRAWESVGEDRVNTLVATAPPALVAAAVVALTWIL